jgi:hypothetical protein
VVAREGVVRRVRILAGHIELDTDDSRNTIVFPRDYVLVFDPSGRSLDKCCLFVGPARFTDDRPRNFSTFDRKWFGDDYDLRIAVVDVPDENWQPCGRVTEMVYFRPGEYEGDWKHPFSEPQPLFKSGKWHMLVLPEDCILTWRGLESP